MALFGKTPGLADFQLVPHDFSSSDSSSLFDDASLGTLTGEHLSGLLGKTVKGRYIQKALGTSSNYNLDNPDDFARYTVQKGKLAFNQYMTKASEDQIKTLADNGITDFKTYANTLVTNPDLVRNIAPSLKSDLFGTAYTAVNPNIKNSKYIGESLSYDTVGGKISYYNQLSGEEDTLDPDAKFTTDEYGALAEYSLNPNRYNDSNKSFLDVWNNAYSGEFKDAGDAFTMSAYITGSESQDSGDDIFAIGKITDDMEVSNNWTADGGMGINLSNQVNNKPVVNPEGNTVDSRIDFEGGLAGFLEKGWDKIQKEGGLVRKVKTEPKQYNPDGSVVDHRTPLGTVIKNKKDAEKAKRSSTFAINEAMAKERDIKLKERQDAIKLKNKEYWDSVGNKLKETFVDPISQAVDNYKAKKADKALLKKYGTSPFTVDGDNLEGRAYIERVLNTLKTTGGLPPDKYGITQEAIDYWDSKGWLRWGEKKSVEDALGRSGQGKPSIMNYPFIDVNDPDYDKKVSSVDNPTTDDTAMANLKKNVNTNYDTFNNKTASGKNNYGNLASADTGASPQENLNKWWSDRIALDDMANKTINENIV
tara:strand:- start:4730 stop:6502 length:1773 start_codon:yes stop_codon:yes gene_type:complete